jgi:hypothetical protein
MRKLISFLAATVALAICCSNFAAAQALTTTPAVVPTQLTVGETLTLTTTGGPFIIPPDGTLSNTVQFTYAYNVSPTRSGGIRASGWLGSATAALSQSGGSVVIPSSNINFSSPNGIPSSPCTGASDAVTGSVAGATCFAAMLNSVAALQAAPSGNNTVNVRLNVITPSSITFAGTYAGTFTFNVVIP